MLTGLGCSLVGLIGLGISLDWQFSLEWLVDTFTLAVLQSGSGVVDVAGGKGELAVELAALGGRQVRWRVQGLRRLLRYTCYGH